MLASTAPKRSPAARSGAPSREALTVVNTSGSDVAPHEHDADPDPPDSGQRSNLIAVTRESRPREDDHGSAQHEDDP